MDQFKWVIAPSVGIAIATALISCKTQSAPLPASGSQPTSQEAPTTGKAPSTDTLAQVVAVVPQLQSEGQYTFRVTIASADTGCDQYANWWEVITADGDLLYRRILAHSHVDEQPFERSGDPVAIAADQSVIVRAHMEPDGYSSQAMKGTVADGFEPTALPEGFTADLATVAPQPNDCAF
ncbi:MAG: hypothetical protein ACFBSG_15440 [Leptolyngbyaceae cyanobacterium]